MMESREIKIGEYQHFKGNKYEVIGIAKHSETMEDLVVYRALDGDKNLWVRPLKMFLEKVDFEEEKVLRFRYLGK